MEPYYLLMEDFLHNDKYLLISERFIYDPAIKWFKNIMLTILLYLTKQ